MIKRELYKINSKLRKKANKINKTDKIVNKM